MAHLPRTGVSLELMTYYYALQIYERLTADGAAPTAAAKAHRGAVYVHPPDEVARRVLKALKRDHVTDDAFDGLVKLFRQSQESRLDFAQVQRLRELDRGVCAWWT